MLDTANRPLTVAVADPETPCGCCRSRHPLPVPSRMVAAGPTCGARYPPKYASGDDPDIVVGPSELVDLYVYLGTAKMEA
jgi:hypothetical protein